MSDTPTSLQEYRANVSFGTPGGTCIVDHVYLIDPTQFADLIDAGFLEPAALREEEAAPLMTGLGAGGVSAAPIEEIHIEENATAPLGRPVPTPADTPATPPSAPSGSDPGPPAAA
jgi:hypothetical protein